MNKIFLMFGVLLLIGVVSAGTEDVMFKIKLEYIPNLQTTCFEVLDNSTNNTWNNCSIISNGQLRITGGEDETHFSVTEYLSDIISGRVYTGYKTADLGNLSDITGINDKLEAFVTCNNDLNKCILSNSNVSSQLTLLEEDRGVKANFTECSTLLVQANSNLENRNLEIKSKSEIIDNLEGSKFMWIFLGIGLGVLAIKVVVPKMQGKDVPISNTGRDHPPNPGYT